MDHFTRSITMAGIISQLEKAPPAVKRPSVSAQTERDGTVHFGTRS